MRGGSGQIAGGKKMRPAKGIAASRSASTERTVCARAPIPCVLSIMAQGIVEFNYTAEEPEELTLVQVLINPAIP